MQWYTEGGDGASEPAAQTVAESAANGEPEPEYILDEESGAYYYYAADGEVQWKAGAPKPQNPNNKNLYLK